MGFRMLESWSSDLGFRISGSGFRAGGCVEAGRVGQVKLVRRQHPRHRFWNYRVMNAWREMLREAALWLPLLAPGPPTMRAPSNALSGAEVGAQK